MKKLLFPFLSCAILVSLILIVLSKISNQTPFMFKKLPTTTSLMTASIPLTNGVNKDTLSKLSSGAIVDMSRDKQNIIKTAFYNEKISKDLKLRMKNKSYKKDCTVPYEDLRYVRVLYYGFDNNTHIGELVVNKQIAKDVTAIFKELYLKKYPIEKMKLIDDYNADDEASMSDNNTSAFNFRVKTSSKTLSKHALGLAIDINPLYNPYVKGTGSKSTVSPAKGYKYKNRQLDIPYYISKNDMCYNTFTKKGFTWGGSWTSLKDYQHFEKSIK